MKREGDGKAKLGFYQKGSHDFISVQNCLLFSEQIGDLIKYLEELLTLERLMVYGERTKTGNLRNIFIKESKSNQEIMLVFISEENKLGIKTEALDNLAKDFPQVTSIYQNINHHFSGVLCGKEWRLLRGKESLEETVHSLRFKISPTSFSQVNITQTEKLNEKILSYIDLKEGEVLLDLYCGVGAIAIYLASQVNKIYGVEIEKKAVRDAQANAELSHLSNLEFFSEKVENW